MTLTKEALDTSGKLRKIIEELGDEFFERRDHVEALFHALLAAEHTFLLGKPGTAKSLLVRSVCGRITGARYWDILLDRQLPTESMFGPIDILEFKTSGAWHRKVDGYAPTAHIAFLDEIGKAGPAVTNPMLTWLNERMFHNNSTPMATPLISAAGASNEELEFPEQAALWDRFLLRMMVEPIQEPGNFAAMLAAKPRSTTPTTVDLAEVEAAVNKHVPSITLPPGVTDSILQLRTDLMSEQIEPSDRRWKQSMKLLKASAFLAGRDTVDDDDLSILRHVLWDVVEQIPVVERKTLALTGPLTRKAMELEEPLDDIEARLDATKGQSVEKRANYGAEASHKLNTIQKEVNDAIEQANRQGRSATRLQQVADRTKNLRVRVWVECLNVPEDRAQKMD